jgi:hypothetical protein
MAAGYGAEPTAPDWCERLVCSKRGSREIDRVVSWTKRRKNSGKYRSRRDLGRTAELLAAIALEGKRAPKRNANSTAFREFLGNICRGIPLSWGEFAGYSLRFFSIPAWQSLPVAGLPPADFAGAAS